MSRSALHFDLIPFRKGSEHVCLEFDFATFKIKKIKNDYKKIMVGLVINSIVTHHGMWRCTFYIFLSINGSSHVLPMIPFIPPCIYEGTIMNYLHQCFSIPELQYTVLCGKISLWKMSLLVRNAI